MEKIFELTTKYVTSKQFYATLIVIVIAIFLIAILKGGYKRYMNRLNKGNSETKYSGSLYRLIRDAIIIVMVLSVLQVNDVNIGSLLAGVGIVSVVVGLSLQDVFKDVLMGFHIINDKSFKVGDCVKINSHEGVVLDFTLLTTKLKDINDGTIVFIPNREISEVAQSFGMYDFDLPIERGESCERLDELFTACAQEIDTCESVTKAVYRGANDFREGATVYRMRIYFKPAEKWAARTEAFAILHRCVVENEIALFDGYAEFAKRVGGDK